MKIKRLVGVGSPVCGDQRVEAGVGRLVQEGQRVEAACGGMER